MYKNKFTTNTSWLMIGKIVQIALTFITTTCIARYLKPEQYGMIGHTFAYVSFFVQVCALGTNEIIVKELVNNKKKNDEIVGTIILFRLIASFCSIAILYFAVVYIENSEILVTLTMLQALSLMFQSFESITYYFQSKLFADKVAVINIVAYTLSALFRIFGLISNKNVNWFAFAVSLDYILVAVFLLYFYFKDGNRIKISFETGKLILKNSWHYLFANVLVVIYSQVDKLFLSSRLGEDAVGLYSAATQICNAWPFILVAIIDSSTPIIIDLYNKNKDAFKKRIKQLYAAIFYIGFIVAILITIFARPIIFIMFGNDYLPSVSALRIVCWNTIFAYFGVSRTIWMQCNNKMSYEKLLALIGAVTNIFLNLLLVNKLGINGAAISFTLTQFITNFVAVYLIKDTRENALLLIDAITLRGVMENE